MKMQDNTDENPEASGVVETGKHDIRIRPERTHIVNKDEQATKGREENPHDNDIHDDTVTKGF